MSKSKTKFAKMFLDWSRHRSFGSCWSDFLEIVLCTLSMKAKEERYLEILAQYPKEDAYTLRDIFHEMQKEYYEGVGPDGGWCDPLGTLWEEYSSMMGKKMSGQFFTPPGLCEVSARMTIGDLKPTEPVRICDPAGGSGRMLLAAGRINSEMNRWMQATSIDIDRTVSMMCAINLFYHGIEGKVVHGNALSLEAWGGWAVRPYALIPRIVWVDREQAERWIKVPLSEKQKAPPEIPTNIPLFTTGSQISLF